MKKLKRNSIIFGMSLCMLFGMGSFLVSCGPETPKAKTFDSNTTVLESGVDYVLKQDITLNNVVDGSNFTGTFNGNGFTITVNNTNKLFDLNINDGASAASVEASTSSGYVFDNFNGTIKNLKVANGSIINRVLADHSVTIEDCSVSGTIVENYEPATRSGEEGIFLKDREGNFAQQNGEDVNIATENEFALSLGAFVRRSDGKLTIKDSTNDAKVSGRKWVGGFVGSVAGNDATLTISNSTNNGEVVGTSAYIGGIVGKVEDARSSITRVDTTEQEGTRIEKVATLTPTANQYDICLEEVVNNGEVSSTNSSVAGIIGGLLAGNTKFDAVVNNGEVTSTSSNIGGLIGTIKNNDYCKEVILEMNDSANNGQVNSGAYSGGLIGKANSTTKKTTDPGTGDVTYTLLMPELYITNSNNAGKIIFNDLSGKTTGHIGGIVGNTSADASITNCYNTAEILSGSNMGGIIGSDTNLSNITLHEKNTEVNIENCYNAGKVQGYTSLGGIAGEIGAETNIVGVYNTANVVGGYIVGGLVGTNGGVLTIEGYEGTLSESYNEGQISGGTHVGGIMGLNNRNATISNVRNGKTGTTLGQVNGTNYNIAGIVGYNSAPETVKYTDLVLNLDNVKNYATVTANANYEGDESQSVYLAGLVGRFFHSTAAFTTTIENSSNYGDLATPGKSKCIIGGILAGATRTAITLENVTNEGDILSAKRYAGGFLGEVHTSSKIDISNSKNLGDINLATDLDSYDAQQIHSFGGLVGSFGSDLGSVVTNSHNEGNINGYIDANKTAKVVGGLFGSLSTNEAKKTTVTNCYNIGKVFGGSSVGGLIGTYVVGDIDIDKCFNAGEIKSIGFTGGLVGGIFMTQSAQAMRDMTVNITNSFSSAKISHPSSEDIYDVGGILGCKANNKYTGSKITLNINNTVVANNYVDGITACAVIGYTYNDKDDDNSTFNAEGTQYVNLGNILAQEQQGVSTISGDNAKTLLKSLTWFIGESDAMFEDWAEFQTKIANTNSPLVEAE